MLIDPSYTPETLFQKSQAFLNLALPTSIDSIQKLFNVHRPLEYTDIYDFFLNDPFLLLSFFHFEKQHIPLIKHQNLQLFKHFFHMLGETKILNFLRNINPLPALNTIEELRFLDLIFIHQAKLSINKHIQNHCKFNNEDSQFTLATSNLADFFLFRSNPLHFIQYEDYRKIHPTLPEKDTDTQFYNQSLSNYTYYLLEKCQFPAFLLKTHIDIQSNNQINPETRLALLIHQFLNALKLSYTHPLLSTISHSLAQLTHWPQHQIKSKIIELMDLFYNDTFLPKIIKSNSNYDFAHNYFMTHYHFFKQNKLSH